MPNQNSTNQNVVNNSLTTQTTAPFTTALGVQALASNTTGGNNTSVGYQALNASQTGSYNVAVGFQALKNSSSSSQNVALGSNALGNGSNTNGNNIAIGYSAVAAVSTGADNLGIGSNALGALSTGGQNTVVGHGAVSALTTGSQNTVIGTNAGTALTAGETNNICIGYNVTGAAGNSNIIRIGNSTSTACFISGIRGVTPTNNNAKPVIIDSAGQLGSIALTNGQVLIGASGSNPAAATLGAGTGIAIANGAGSITISSTALSSGPLGQILIGSGTSAAFNSLGVNSGLTAHGVLLGQGTGAITTNAPGILGTMLISQSTNSDPIFGALGVNSNLSGILLGQGTNAVIATSLGNGQLLIGASGTNPYAATLGAGTNITITNGTGSIIISASGGGSSKTYVTSSATAINSITTADANKYWSFTATQTVTVTIPQNSSQPFSLGTQLYFYCQNSAGGGCINFTSSDTLYNLYSFYIYAVAEKIGTTTWDIYGNSKSLLAVELQILSPVTGTEASFVTGEAPYYTITNNGTTPTLTYLGSSPNIPYGIHFISTKSYVLGSSGTYFFAVQNTSGSALTNEVMLGFIRKDTATGTFTINNWHEMFAGNTYRSFEVRQWTGNGNWYYNGTQTNYSCTQDWLTNQYFVISINPTTWTARFYDSSKVLIAGTTNSFTVTGQNFMSLSYGQEYYYPAIWDSGIGKPMKFEPNFAIAGETNLLA